MGGPEQVGAAPGVERQVHGPPHGELHGEQRAARPGGASLRCCHRASEGILHRVAAGGRTLYGRVEPAGYRGAARSRQEREGERRRLHTFRLTGDPILSSDFDGASTGRSSRGRRAKTFRLLEHRENSRSN